MSRVLLIDDERRFCQATSETLRQHGHSVTTANCLAAAREALRDLKPELVLLDLMLPDGNGLELLEDFDERETGLVAIITGHPAIKDRIQSLAGRNVAYLTKPVDMEELFRLTAQIDAAPKEVEEDQSLHFGVLIGESDEMHAVYDAIERFGQTAATILIQGESGTGKELVAKAVHRASGRRGRFVPTNCGALAGELVASELFGHEKGSFTGATRRHAGVFERADGGTLFLDEISEMPTDMQAYLLRSLEAGEIIRVGGEEETKIDARLLAATNRPLGEIARERVLREDLYYRLSEFVIRLPPLRERGDDIDLLVERFVADLNRQYGCTRRPSSAFLERCREYAWPGNVRELRHVVHRAYVLADGPHAELSARHDFESPFANGAGEGLRPGRAIRDVERELIVKTLAHFEGDKRMAADALGISLKTLYNRLNEYKRSDGAKRAEDAGQRAT